jgi:hypothetical protein
MLVLLVQRQRQCRKTSKTKQLLFQTNTKAILVIPKYEESYPKDDTIFHLKSIFEMDSA